MNIEIKPLSYTVYDSDRYNSKTCFELSEVRELEATLKEAIEAFKELLFESLNNYDGTPNSQRRAAESYYRDEINIIEKAYKKSWKELTE